MKTISLFDWNGELYQQVQDDEATFNIKLSKIEGSESMGFTAFKIEGSEKAIKKFLNYYELKLNPKSFTTKIIEEEMEKKASDHYQGVAHDLPRQGNYQYLSTIDHLADYLYDNFRKKYPEANYRKVAKRVANRYLSSDTVESNRNEKRWANWANKIPKAKKEKPPKIKSWDQRKPINKGVGSY